MYTTWAKTEKETWLTEKYIFAGRTFWKVGHKRRDITIRSETDRKKDQWKKRSTEKEAKKPSQNFKSLKETKNRKTPSKITLFPYPPDCLYYNLPVSA